MPMVLFSYEMTIYELRLLLFCDLSVIISFHIHNWMTKIAFFSVIPSFKLITDGRICHSQFLKHLLICGRFLLELERVGS